MSSNPLEEGAVTGLLLSEGKESSEGMAVVAGHASPEEQAILPGVGKLASIAIFGVYPDGTVRGVTVVLPLSRLTGGARLVIGEDVIAGGVWTIPPGATVPDRFSPLTAGTLVLSEGGTEQGATIVGSFGGSFGSGDSPSELSEGWEFGELEVRFTTTWGSNESLNLSTEAELPFLSLNGVEQPSEDIVVIAGHAGPDESRLLPGKGKLASLAVIGRSDRRLCEWSDGCSSSVPTHRRPDAGHRGGRNRRRCMDLGARGRCAGQLLAFHHRHA